MPTETGVRKAVEELREGIEALQFTVSDISGPISSEIDNQEDEQDSSVQYYIIFESERGSAFILLSTIAQFGQVTFPFSITRDIGARLDDNEIEEIGGVPDVEELSDEEHDDLLESAGLKILNNTEAESLHIPQFQVARSGTSEHVSYHEETAENGFPTEIQCRRAVFPYSGKMRLNELDNRIESVINTGVQARNYVESAIVIDDDGGLENYSLKALF